MLYHEDYGKLPQTPDIMDLDSNDDIKLRPSPSPISIFVLNGHYELEIAVIQINDSKSNTLFIYFLAVPSTQIYEVQQFHKN